jgi:hypothetical protein
MSGAESSRAGGSANLRRSIHTRHRRLMLGYRSCVFRTLCGWRRRRSCDGGRRQHSWLRCRRRRYCVRLCSRLWTRCRRKRDSSHIYWLRLYWHLRLGCNRRCNCRWRRRGRWRRNRNHRALHDHRLSHRNRSRGPRLLGGDFHRNSRRGRPSLLSRSNGSPDPVFQTLQLSGKVRNFVVEFGSFTPPAAVGHRRNDDGWQANHYPAQDEERYPFH